MSEVVPEGWRKIKLGEVGKFSTSSVDKKTSIDEQEVFLLNYMDVYNHSILTGNYPFQRVTAPTKQISSSSVQQGDVFFTPSSETPDDVGHSAVFIGDKKKLVHSYHTVRFRPSSDVYIDDDFKPYAFKGEKTYEYFRKRATGSTRFTVSLPVFNDLEITIPPLPEQKKIASILTSVDEVIEKTQSQIDKLQDLKKGTMNELLTKGIGHTEFKDSELGRIPKSWEVGIVSDLGKVVTGSTPNTTNRELYDGDFMFVSPSDISEEMFVEGTDKTVTLEGLKTIREIPLNSVMIVCIGSTIGKVALTTDRCATNQQINTIVPENADPFFIYFLMKMMANLIRKESGTQAVPLINKTDFSNLMIKKPPIDEQRVIGRYLSSFNSAILKKTNKLHQTQSLKKSLMQDLLTGKVRVSVN